VIDHRGAVVARTDLGVRALVIRGVGLRTGRTDYERFGDLPVLVLAALLVVVGWISALSSDSDPERDGAARRERQALYGRRAMRTRP
jgi:apolipoprotein N-acyltransferase